MGENYSKQEIASLVKRVAQIKIVEIDYSLEQTKDFGQFVEAYNEFSNVAQNLACKKCEEAIRVKKSEARTLRSRAQYLESELTRKGLVSNTRGVYENTFNVNGYTYNENVDIDKTVGYNFFVTVPAREDCDEITLQKDFEINFDRKIASFKSDIKYHRSEASCVREILKHYIEEKKKLSIFKDHAVRKDLSQKIKGLAEKLENMKRTIFSLEDGLDAIEEQKQRIMSISNENRALINELIDCSIKANWTLLKEIDELERIRDSFYTPHPYSITYFLKATNKKEKYKKILKDFAQYLEDNGVSDKGLDGKSNFPVEDYLEFGEYEEEVLMFIKELDKNEFREVLGLAVNPEMDTITPAPSQENNDDPDNSAY